MLLPGKVLFLGAPCRGPKERPEKKGVEGPRRGSLVLEPLAGVKV